MEQIRPELIKQSITAEAQPQAFHQRKQYIALQDTTQWVNNQASVKQPSQLPTRKTPLPVARNLPHHTSLAPGRSLQNRKMSNPSPAKAEDKRVSAISSENKTNRDSEYSTTSTNISAKSKPKKAVGPWRLGKTIGKGATGRVRKARHQYTDQNAAIKIISKKSAEMFKSQSIMAMDTLSFKTGKTDGRKLMPFGIERECVIMKLIDHPNIISLYDIWENRGELYLVLEHVEGGELFHHILQNGRLSEPEAVRIFRQIIAALSYCHSFHICHRDLKPENILLDQDFNVKLVDFGMAALQPAHQWLQTSCGSPHYACPEVIQQHPYRGDLADVWSAGVVLYAMLCGGLPFASDLEDPEENMLEVTQKVIEGDWDFPERGFSPEAEHFVAFCLHPEPAKRMRTRNMWSHPLVKRYESLDPLDHQGRRYVGPAPHLSAQDCGASLRFRTQIDGEILRNLRNLWHSVSEADLIQRLLSDQANHERVMYAKLQQFQDRLLENYQSPQIDHSTSDYHHAVAQPLQRTTSRASLPAALGQQQPQASRFSLLQPGTYRPQRIRSQSAHARQNSRTVTEATEESYDPFRPSKTRIASASQADRMKVTILRNPSRAASRPSSSRLASRGSARHPPIDELKAEDNIGSPPSSAGNSARRIHFNKMASNQRQFSRGNSRVTLVSNRSVNSTSSSLVNKKAVGSKRNVTFPHQQRRMLSGQKRLRNIENTTPNYTLYQQYIRGEKEINESIDRASQMVAQAPTASRTPIPGSPIKSPRKRQRLDDSLESRPISLCARNDACKASDQIARLCDETFNRDSVASTVDTPAPGFRNSQQSYHTRATSISADEYAKSSLPSSRDGPTYKYTKPLPQTPASQSQVEVAAGAYLPLKARDEVAKTADMLRQRQRDSGIPPGAFEKLIKHLDGLMLPSDIRVAEAQRRAASTPDPTIPRKDTFEQIMGDTAAYRAISAPVKTRQDKTMSTIRLVESEEEGYQPLSPIKPLTIRKKSGSSGKSGGSTPKQKSFPLQRQPQCNRPFTPMISDDDEGLAAIKESSDKENFDPVGRNGDSKGERKKRNWFRRNHSPKRSREIEVGPPLPPPRKYDPMPSHQRHDSGPAEWQTQKKNRSQSRPPLSSKKSFLDLFRKGKTHERSNSDDADYYIDDSASQSSYSSSTHHRRTSRNSSTSTVVHHQPSHSSVRQNTQTEPTNWLARFFRIRPASMVICVQLSRARARREIVTAFRAWKKYGMQEIVTTKGPVTTIRARVDAENALRIPPMKLVVEVHEVLYKGRRAGLSVARLVQEKGAKGSFERVARALEDVLKEKGVLVEDKGVVAEIRRGIGF